jgi:hypothetical protein
MHMHPEDHDGIRRRVALKQTDNMAGQTAGKKPARMGHDSGQRRSGQTRQWARFQKRLNLTPATGSGIGVPASGKSRFAHLHDVLLGLADIPI